jgi:cysteinyl-tRNA synthetase
MSKSLGNVFDCDQIADAVGGEALRFFCVKHHYRAPVDFEVDVRAIRNEVRFTSLEQADRDLAYFYDTLSKLDAFLGAERDRAQPVDERWLAAAREALADDFNTPGVIRTLYDAAKEANKLLESAKGIDKQERRRKLANLAADLREIGGAVGIFTQQPVAYLADRRARLARTKNLDVAAIERKLAERASARAAKDYARGDAIRDELAAMGVEVLDSRGSSDWRVLD